MRRVWIGVLMLLLLCVANADAQAQKKQKTKEKRYEPVTRPQLKDYAGRYVGIADSYFIEVLVAPNGSELFITSYEGERRAVLREIRLAGPILTARKVYADGTTENFSGVFAHRILNGQTAFGLIVDGLHIRLEGNITLSALFYRHTEAGALAPSEAMPIDSYTARREIEARHAEMAEAVRSRDTAALLSLRAESYAAWPPSAGQAGESMAFLASLDSIHSPINLTSEIETLILLDHEAIAIVRQRFSRMEERDGRWHLVETSGRQRETWIRTALGWKLTYVDGMHDQQTYVDGVAVESRRAEG